MKRESETIFQDPEATAAVQQLRKVSSDITGLTEKLTVMITKNDLDSLASILIERRHLLNRAQDIRNWFAASMMNYGIEHEMKQAFSPIILQLYEADARLLSTLSSRKNELRDQLDHVWLQQKVAL